jgi:hypothetical protein
MRILGSIVLSATKIMVFGKLYLLQCSTVRWQFVGDEGIRDKALFLQQIAHQFERSLLVSARLNQDIQHFTFTIYCPPQIHPFAVDGGKHFVQVPLPIRAGTQSPELAGIVQPELYLPAPDRFVRHIYAALSEHIFDIAKAEGKPEIQPDGVLNDRRWKSVSCIGDFLHPATLLCCQRSVTKLV